MTAAKAVYEKYNKDYQNRSKVSGLNDSAKEELQRRKKILDEAGPKIKAYDEAVKGNLPVDKDLAKWMDAFLKKYRWIERRNEPVVVIDFQGMLDYAKSHGEK